MTADTWNCFGLLLLTLFALHGAALAAVSLRGPYFEHEPPEQVQFTNTSGAVVPCSAQGEPTPTISWQRKDGAPVTDIPGIREKRPDGSLIFQPFSSTQFRQDVHRQTYRCVATNALGTAISREVRVEAVVLQVYEVLVYNQFVIRGNTAVLRCHIPAVVRDYVRTVAWMREDGSPIPSDSSGSKYLFLPNGDLIIRQVNPVDAFKGYRCKVHDKLTGKTTLSVTTGKLIVTESTTPVQARITESLPYIRVLEGDTVHMPCIGLGHPVPRHTWFKQDNNVLVPIRSSRHVIENDGILIIQRATVRHSGTYVCVVNNTAGMEKQRTELVVTVPLSVRLEPQIQTVEVGAEAMFSCRITGHPIQSVSWYKDGRPLTATRWTSVISRDTLKINSVQREDRGTYQCFSSNEWESAQGTAQLIIREEAPAFDVVFQPVVIRPGNPVSLKCSASGNPLPQITWTLDGTTLVEAYHLRVGDYVSDEHTVNSYVNISSVRVEDGGTFGCVAHNSAGEVRHTSRLNVVGPPYIRAMKNRTALAGRSMIIHCPYAGYPIEKVAWERDSRRLPQNHRQKVFPNGTLVIQDMQKGSDSGWYTCIAEDKDGRSARRDVMVEVMVPPIVDKFNFPTDLTEGKRAGVACVVSAGDHPIKIQWLKDGLPIPESLQASVLSANDYTSFLSFPQVSQAHNGNYTCLARNPVATANKTASMVVQVPPRWRTDPEDKIVVMGQSATFDCQADGYPVPVIRWKKSVGGPQDDFRVVISNANMQILENGSLTIREAAKEDAGHYMCQAINGVGPGLSTVVKLTVHVAAHFKRRFESQTAKKGDTIVLKCEAFGEKPINVSWSKDRHPLSPSLDPRYITEERQTNEGVQSSVRIPSADRRDSSLFSCTAKNEFGEDTTNFQVVVQEPPDCPSDLTTTTIGSRSITLSWSHPYSGNSPITAFVIEYKLTSESWESRQQSQRADGSESIYTIQGLNPQTSYDFRLQAENALGSSGPCKELTISTDQEAPTGPPREVRVTVTGSHTLQVTWKPPSEEQQHGPIQGYYVGYRETGVNEPFAYKTIEAQENSDQQCVLNGLRKVTRYSVVVQAFNSKGAGPPTEEVIAQTMEYDPPPAPSLRLVSSTTSSIHVAWSPLEKVEDPVTGYVLFYKSEITEWEEVQVSVDRSGYTFRNLQCGRKYQFYILSFNNAGRGQPSDVISGKTEGTAPVAPDRRSLLAINSTAVAVHLTSWQSGGCPISFFVVQYKQRHQKEWLLLSNNILPEQKIVYITDLSPSTWYTLLMTSQNDAGSTEAEYVFATLTPSGGTVPPLSSSEAQERQFFQQLKIVIPIVCTTVVLLLIMIVTCVVFVRRRQINANSQPVAPTTNSEVDSAKVVDSVPMSVWEKRAQADRLLGQSREQLYFPSPYATSRVSMYSADGDPESVPPHSWRPERCDMVGEHTYDVPFLNRKGLPPDGGGGQALFTTQTHGRHLYLNPSVVELPSDRFYEKTYFKSKPSNSELSVSKARAACLYSQQPRRTRARRHRSSREHRRPLSAMKLSSGCSDEESDNEETTYTFSDTEAAWSQPDHCEFSEAECDMHMKILRMANPDS